jgi:hypothetical protein
MFVTQVPAAFFGAVTSPFGNQQASVAAAPRGGDLMIRYPDGTIRNLTREAGFGNTGPQGDKAIAVREPCVHWDGNKALFSMVIGAPKQFDYNDYHWQIYEVSGIAQGEAVEITKVANQPEDYNNVAPIYGSDDRIIFASDRPRNGEEHLYPQLDEYESAQTVTGLWSLNPTTGDLKILNHAPSGVFSPQVDSFGRIVFTKWDHLQRDQQADADRNTPGRYGSFTYADETAAAAKIADLTGQEMFPEAHDGSDPDATDNVELHRFNQFLPWELNQDGTAEETLNHIGRHELGGSYIEGSFKDDPNLQPGSPDSFHKNRYDVAGDGGLFHIKEDLRHPGVYYATYAREFGTATGGALVKITGAPTLNADEMDVIAVTHRDSSLQPDDPSDAPNSTGHYRNPLPLADDVLVAVHTAVVGPADNLGTRAAPNYNYKFRLTVLKKDGDYYKADSLLTPGIQADVSWFDPDVAVAYKGPLWELDPVEVTPRTRPVARVEPIAAPEMSVFTDVGVDPDVLSAWLAERDLALIISRNVTKRERSDRQQPFNLRVPGGVETVSADGKVYDIQYFQVVQGDALRGYGGVDAPRRGRRLLARPMHGADISPTPDGAPAGSVTLGADGSMAAFVPARRALSWQLTSPTGTPVVRERNWVSFQAGEIRTCAVCHGVNTFDQKGEPVPQNPPEALRVLLTDWKATQ